MVRGNYSRSTQRRLNLALHEAVHKGDEQETVRLLEAGAKVNSVRYTYTTLHVAVACGHTHLLKHLIKYKGNLELPARYGFRPIHMLIYCRDAKKCLEGLTAFNINLNGQDERGKTILHLLIEQTVAKTEKVMELLNFKFDFNAVDFRGNNYLHEITMCKKSRDDQVKMAAAFIDAGVDVNTRNYTLNTPLHEAIERKLRKLIEIFMESGADIRITNKDGENALEMAYFLERLDAMDSIISHSVLSLRRGHMPNTIMEIIESITDADYIFKFYDRIAEGYKERFILPNSHVTLYDILFSSLRKVVKFFRHYELVKKLESLLVAEKSVFWDSLTRRYEKAEEIRHKQDKIRKAVDIITGQKLSALCINRVAHFIDAEKIWTIKPYF